MFYFLIKKLLTRVPYIPVSGWHLRHLGSACDVAQLPILTIHRLPRCVVVLSFTWCGTYSLVMVELSPMIDLFLFFSFLSLSWQLKCTIVLFVCYFSISVLILWISYFVLIPFIEVFFFQFCHSITISYMFYFHFSPHFFNFLFCFYSFYSFSPSKFVPIFCWYFRIHPLCFDFGHFLFCLSYIYLQFSPSILICVYYVFQFGHFTFNF